MIEIKGKHATAKIFADTLEASAEGQIRVLCDSSFVSGSQVRVMPDVHAGKGSTIGTTMTIGDYVVPAMVGVDIGCGMETLVIPADSATGVLFAKGWGTLTGIIRPLMAPGG